MGFEGPKNGGWAAASLPYCLIRNQKSMQESRCQAIAWKYCIYMTCGSVSNNVYYWGVSVWLRQCCKAY